MYTYIFKDYVEFQVHIFQSLQTTFGIYGPYMYLTIECNIELMCIFSFWLLENFTDHEIDMTTFTSLTDADLREIGVSTVGARRKMLWLSSGK